MLDDLLPDYIELETSTLCNRSCPWCPNSRYKRSKSQELISTSLFDKIISDLSEVGYSNQIALHNYNEPLLDPHLFRHISKIRQTLPEAQVLILTNGDLLDEEYCKRLEESDVSLLRITLYGAIGLEDPERLLYKHMEQCGLDGRLDDVSDNFGKKIVTKFGRMSVVYYLPNKEMFTSRGGLVEEGDEISESYACFLPFSSCAIDYEGNMKLCCEVYPADEFHQSHGIIGNLRESSFSELWFSDAYNQLRKEILLGTVNNEICLKCRKKPRHAHKIDTTRLERWENHLKG